MPKRIYGLIILLVALMLACGGRGSRESSNQVPPTKTSLPTFTPSPTLTLQPLLPSPTPVSQATPTQTPTLVIAVDTPTPPPTDTPVIETPTEEPTPVSEATPTNTPVPPPPTDTPTPEPVIKYVLAGTNREFNCDFTYIYGSVRNANNFGIPDVEVRALGIHETTGQDFISRTDADGNYEIFRIPLNDLLAAQWAVMLMENGGEVSERFHWASTPVCESDDLGHSQVLRVDWKLIE